MTILFKPCMFITSFFPVWLSIIIYNIFRIIEKPDSTRFPLLSIVIILVINAIAMLDVLLELKRAKKKQNIKKTIKYVRKDKSTVLTFILTIALPFVAFDFTKIRDYCLLLVFIIIVFIVCQHNRIILPNIILMALRYNYYECIFEASIPDSKDHDSEEYTVITKDNHFLEKKNQDIEAYKLNNDIYLA